MTTELEQLRSNIRKTIADVVNGRMDPVDGIAEIEAYVDGDKEA